MRLGMAVVRGRSMEPTLRDGDRLIVSYARQPRTGDLVLVRLPDRSGTAVKRATFRDARGWWVERDNPSEGVDSWLVGSIPDDHVLAVVQGRLWPAPRPLSATRRGRR